MTQIDLFQRLQQLNTHITALSVGLYLVLALMAWTARRQDRVMLVFASLTLVMAAADLAALWAQAAGTLEQFAFRMRLTMVAHCLMPLAVLHHVLAICGRDQHPEDQVLGVRVTPVSVLVGLNMIAVVVAVQLPGLLVTGYRAEPATGGFEPVLSGAMLALMGVQIAGIGVICLAVMRRALSRARSASRRDFLRLNLAGVLLILGATPLFGVVLPLLGLQANVPLHLSLVAAAVVFYQAINRYQLDRFQELNSGLEAEVEARTLDLRQAQACLVHAEAMAAVGRLAAGVTHEVNSPLAALLSASDTIGSAVRRVHRGEQAEASPGQAPPRDISRSLRAVQQSQQVLVQAACRMQQVVTNLQQFVGLDAATQGKVDLNACLDSTLELLAPELAGLQIHRSYQDRLPMITASRHELGQLFAHLLQNASTAMGGQGQISIRTETLDHQLRITVQDTGPGIPLELRAGLFTPRLVRAGSRVKLGVGLATCQRIAREHGGELVVNSADRGGVAVRLTLPLDGVEGVVSAA